MERATWVIRTLLELALSVLMVWYMLPTHQRREMLMHLAQQTEQVSTWCALKTGRQAMRRELAGDLDSAEGAYALARRIMTGPAEAAGRWYESLRAD